MNPNTSAQEPTIIVIFGITGDLAKRKLLPALYQLYKNNLVHEQTRILGLSRQSLTVDELMENVELCVLEKDNICDPAVLQEIRSKLHMSQLDPANPDEYDELLNTLNALEAQVGMCMNRLYYLSIPPQVFATVVRNLGEKGLNGSCQHGNAHTGLLVEKPFGYDLASAEELIRITTQQFKEEQILRIDHYLAKETAQNILAFRHYNPAFAQAWNDKDISQIIVRAYEKIGVEGRANFYDHVGALRDLIQSHLVQLLALVTLELPADRSDGAALHRAKQALLESISPADPALARRAQYTSYREEVQKPDSQTETFVRLQLHISNERWNDTEVILETGKGMDRKTTEIIVTFADKGAHTTNPLAFRLQPNEGIDIGLTVKKPGFDDMTQQVVMDFSYDKAFDGSTHPDAYVRVLVDALRGDHALFATSEEVVASWHILQPILDAWQQDGAQIAHYDLGWNGAGDP